MLNFLKSNRYKVGDKIRVVVKRGSFTGKTGKIKRIDGEYIYAIVENVELELYRCEIEHA